jgi:hypothetical protein
LIINYGRFHTIEFIIDNDIEDDKYFEVAMVTRSTLR